MPSGRHVLKIRAVKTSKQIEERANKVTQKLACSSAPSEVRPQDRNGHNLESRHSVPTFFETINCCLQDKQDSLFYKKISIALRGLYQTIFLVLL